MSKRIKTKYTGVYYQEQNRRGKTGTEKVFYIVFRKDGQQHEEKAGKQFQDNMTAAKAAIMRVERIEGKRSSNMERRAEQRRNKAAKANRWTIARLWEEYKTMNQNNKGLVQDQNRYDRYIGPQFGNKEPKNITALEIGQFSSLLLKSKQPATVRNILEILRRITNFGKRNQLCKGLEFEIPMPKIDNIKTEVLSPEQLSRFLRVLDEEPNIPVANMLRLALFTGMRRGEIFALKWKDIDFEQGFIYLRDPKGGKSQSIPLNDEAKRILEPYQKSRNTFVFPGIHGNQRTDAKRAANKIKAKAELPDDFRPFHGLRHTYASLLASSGQVELYTLQKLLTHKSPQMTQRYAHLRDETLKTASNLASQIVSQMQSRIDFTEN